MMATKGYHLDEDDCYTAKLTLLGLTTGLIVSLFGEEVGAEALRSSLQMILKGDNSNDVDLLRLDGDSLRALLSAKSLEGKGYDIDKLIGYEDLYDITSWVQDGYIEDAEIDDLERKITDLQEALEEVPLEWKDAARPLFRLLNSATGKKSLIEGKPVRPAQLAALANTTVKTVQNLVSRKMGKIAIKDGTISADIAIPWLLNRGIVVVPDFNDDELDSDDGLTGETTRDDRRIIVPIDRKGRPFDASCEGDKGFKFGPRDNPIYQPDYWKALARLRSMEAPAWRRRNPKTGKWMIVRGKSVGSFTVEELGVEVE